MKTGHQRLQTLGRLNGVETILEASSVSDVIESVKVSRWPMLSDPSFLHLTGLSLFQLGNLF